MANYKTSWVQRLIEGAWQKTFAFAHAKTVYTDYANKKTLADKLSEIDTEIGNKANKTEIPTELPANGGNSATVNGHTVKSDVPENAVFTDTVYDDTKIQKRISDNGYGEVAGGKNLSSINKFTNDITDTLTYFRVQFGAYKNNNRVDMSEILINSNGKYQLSLDLRNIDFDRLRIKHDGISRDINILWLKESRKSVYTLSFICSGFDTTVIGGLVLSDIQVELGSVATPYEPYFPSNKMLAEENAHQSTEMMDIKMLGWSVPKECPIQNEVNGNQFVQRVGRVDLGTLYWMGNLSGKHFRLLSTNLKGIVKGTESSQVSGNIYTPTLKNVSADSTYLHQFDKSISINQYGDLYVYDSAYSDATAFKSAMQGKYLYYELATPITTTIDGNEIGETISDVRKETTVNLLNPTLKTTTRNGVTCTNNGDGTYTVDGTNNYGDEVVFWCGNTQKFKAGTYKLLGTPNNTTASIGGSLYGKVEYEGVIVSIDSEISGDVAIVIPNGISCDNLIFKPMLTTNLSATYDDFVPYTGDSGSLNGDVADLRSDVDYVNPIKSTNVAWIDSTVSIFSGETNGITYEYMGDGAIKISGTVEPNSIDQKIAYFIGEIPDSVGRGKVKLLGLPFNTSNESFNIGLKISGPGGAGTVAKTSSKDGVIIDLSKIPSSASISGIYLSIPNGTVIPNDFIIRPFLTTNLNATLSDFVPYTGSKGQLNDDLSQVAYSIGNPSKLLTNQKILVNAINELNNRLTALENK